MFVILVQLLWICVVNGQTNHSVSKSFTGNNLTRIAFPVGGTGAGMFCVEGTGAISNMSIENQPNLFFEPAMFAAISVKGDPSKAKVLEGPVPAWKKFGMANAGTGGTGGATWGLSRFGICEFRSRFPFASISLSDKSLPLKVTISVWSPFIPTDENNSGLPVAGLEYSFANTGNAAHDFVFSFNSSIFMGKVVKPVDGGFDFSGEGTDFAVFTNEPAVIVDKAWFRGNWFDPLTMAWNHIQHADAIAHDTLSGSTGASLYVPFHLKPGEQKTIHLMICWFVPDTKQRGGWSGEAIKKTDSSVIDKSVNLPSPYFKPWYSSRFKSVDEVAQYWKTNYDSLKSKTLLFTNAFYRSTLPSEITEAVAANLSILKSPTIMRQYDGRFWGWEGSGDAGGSCPGSCTHVYNYAQSLSHLFPALERSMRQTEFNEDQNTLGKQCFRALIPIRLTGHEFYAAADGQLGGIMKVYRDWRISGDSMWLQSLFPRIRLSMDYCIATWDPRHTGTLEEPHHNTYDIEFWGANGFTTSFYLGALEAYIQMAGFFHEDVSLYRDLLNKGRTAMNTKLFNGEYFNQKIQWTGLSAEDPVTAAKKSFGGAYSPEAIELLQKEGPKYQYGAGCLSDGVIGAWMAKVCGLSYPFDSAKIKSHLLSVYKYNFKTDLSEHSNPQRPTYALGHEGGLLLCTWPKGGKLTLPFVYSNEVWTGIEYEVASHLIFEGHLNEGLQIVRTLRKRYDGVVRNPYDEYECGHWYARAMSSYALIEACTGVRYDAVTKTLYVDSKIGDFVSFLSTNTGFGNVIYKNGKASLQCVYGNIPVNKIMIKKA